ncbi:MAG: hypothetical protein LC126_14630 [Bryobacterales bacterium]|nr:hypothetical protein [Bryobacterales bacterium]
MSQLLDPFIPRPDVRDIHEIVVAAPAEFVFRTACNFDLESPVMVRAIIWLRGRILGAAAGKKRRPAGIIEDTLAMGWGKLAEDPGRYYTAGAACRPWRGNVVFCPIPADQFAAYLQADEVKIAWTLEVEALAPTKTRLTVETRAAATDAPARRKFRRYWRWASLGIRLIRRLLLSAVRREAERAWNRHA